MKKLVPFYFHCHDRRPTGAFLYLTEKNYWIVKSNVTKDLDLSTGVFRTYINQGDCID